MSELISAILAFALILIPAIIIHELGHFFAAKLVGISVLEFGVGFPPRVVKLFRWGETDFTLNLLPIGGFVRPFGEDLIGPSNTEGENEEGEKRKNDASPDYISERDELILRGVAPEKIRSVNDVKPLPRIFFMAAGALANFATAVVLFSVIALIGLPQEIGARVQIAEIPANSIYANQGVAVGDAVELVNGNLFQSHYDFLELLKTANGTLTLTMRRIETNENYTVTITPSVKYVAGQVFITAVVDGTPGDEAGLQPNDVIIAIDGTPFPANGDPIQIIQQKTADFAGQPLALTVMRDGEQFSVTLTPRVNPPKGEGRIGLGITAQYMTSDGVVYVPSVPQTKLIPQSFGTSVQYGFQRTGDTLGIILSLPVKLIQGVISPEEARPVSIVGISRVGGEILNRSIKQGTPIPILEFIALVSIFLGFSNLLPIPALDGGRILFALIELVRGKPVPLHIESRVHLFGFIILLLLGLIVIVYDIFNPLVLR
jgi:regulator of sigma E protease